ncbi:hypothetical protein P280DRAFT_520850 [Massarina eburnea CBS 473.64]|uniref:Uncharacterized protein n=1 Tax=Massarina eburnea CBS 473.64 TaxID=1395130 RepID=A0A6A6RR83_9PLEO|nr:hypothetical protein P280DRAFT_520850 [Massarina eburnea CBS 473.64]
MTTPYDLPPRPFAPTSGDVRAARSILTSLGLATELALQILDYAKYWTVITTENIDHLSIVDEHWNQNFSAVEPYLWIPLHLGAHPDGEIPKIREIEFIIVAHDQGWTTEGTKGTYQTSSWFEVSHVRPKPGAVLNDIGDGGVYANIEQIRQKHENLVTMLPRPSQEMEPQRKHNPHMRKLTWPHSYQGPKPDLDEGTHAWWLQGNVVARDTSIFEGEMVKRYKVIWGCAANPRFEGDEGAGRGEGFVDGLEDGDRVAVWARAKRRGWENHVFGVRAIVRYTI